MKKLCLLKIDCHVLVIDLPETNSTVSFTFLTKVYQDFLESTTALLVAHFWSLLKHTAAFLLCSVHVSLVPYFSRIILADSFSI